MKNVASLVKECPTLKAIVVIGELNNEQQALATEAGLEVRTFADVEKAGEAAPVDLRLPKPDDLAILMYTSGTTSTPKGVLITHTNLVSAVAGVLQAVMPISSDDVFLSYLPLAHILERASEAAMFSSGASVGFYQGVRLSNPSLEGIGVGGVALWLTLLDNRTSASWMTTSGLWLPLCSSACPRCISA